MTKTKNKIAYKLYHELLAHIDATPANLKTLELACHAYANYTEAQAVIDAEGAIVTSPQGTKANPACKVQVDNFSIWLKAIKELKLTPNTSGATIQLDTLDEYRA